MINTFCSKWKGSFPEIEDLLSVEKDFLTKKARWEAKEQTLSIGIMGQVKAGKSSFLNALLFNGEQILPEAATPKTANLTKIGYGDKFSLLIEYYSLSEWQQIKEMSKETGDSIEVKVAKELIDMAERLPQSEQIRCLTAKKEVINHDSLSKLQSILNQYTGNDGSHTPLVKSTEILLPHPELIGYEIVDTPGMNDPVASRTQKTREYMANCDVVFFLSRCSQFLDKADDILLRDQLPNKGVKRLVLIACQYDSVILDDGYDRHSLAETEKNINTRILRSAKNKTDEWIKDKYRKDDPLIENIKNPILASSFAYGFGNWEQNKWTKIMAHTYGELCELAQDEWNYQFTQEDWLRIGNFEKLEQQFTQAKIDRKILLDKQKQDVLPNYKKNIKESLDRLSNKVLQHQDFLLTKDISDITYIKNTYEKRMKNVILILNKQLSKTIDEAKTQSFQLIQRLEKDQQHFKNLNTRKGSTTITTSREVSDSKWYNPFSWGSTRTVYDSETISYNYINRNDAIENINQYYEEVSDKITKEFNQLISPRNLKLELKKTLVGQFDTQESDFDPKLFRTMLDDGINKLNLPVFNIQFNDTTGLISQNFSTEVKGDDKINQLKKQLAKSLQMIFQELQIRFEKHFSELLSELDKIKNELENSLTNNIQQELDKLEKQLTNKQDEVTCDDKLLKEIKQLKIVYESYYL